MTTTKQALDDVKVGDVLIMNGRDIATVDRVTPARVYADGKTIRRDGKIIGTYGYASCATEQDISRIKEKKAKESAAKQAESEAREARAVAEMAEAKAACDGVLPITSSVTLPDGCRLVTLSLPVKNSEAKGAYDIVIVKLKTELKCPWDEDCKETQSLASIAFTSERYSCFAITSAHDNADDEAALWDIVCSRYHGW